MCYIVKLLSLLIILKQMSFITILGRILIATTLISSAYLHYSRSENIDQFKNNYTVVDRLSNKYLSIDIPYDKINWSKVVKIFGGFEALIALLIIVGDSLGGIFYLANLNFELFFFLWPKISNNTLILASSWKKSELQELIRIICLIGIALLILLNTIKARK